MHRDAFGDEKKGRQTPPPAVVSPPSTSTASTSIGVHLRVTGHCSQGGRKYMEDFFSVAYHQSENTKDLEYAFVGIYDGHGGSEAATFAKEHLMMEIINQKLFWSDCDQDVLRAIREGYIATHYAMWREQEKWPKTATGLPSTAGTTATVAFIRHEKIYIGHVGDSGIVLGYQNSDENFWRAKQLTLDHKPESAVEKARIINSGGKVIAKSGVPRVVWNRPRSGHKGPVRRSTPIDEIPFLAVARSLGDLWSYNSALNEFIVSPDPDVKVVKINPETFRCLIFGTDGLWNVVTPDEAVDTVREKEIINESINKVRGEKNTWCNPSKGLVERALKIWSSKKMRADNTSVVTVILHPPEYSSPKTNSVNNFASSHGLEYMHMNEEVNPTDGYSQRCSQKFDQNAGCNLEHRLFDTDSLDQTHHLPHYETIATYSNMRQRLQQQFSSENGYTQSYFGREDIAYGNNYQINCDNSEYMYYDDQVSNNYIKSFAESYNSSLSPNLEDNSRSNGSSCTSSYSDESNESNPCEYHSYNSLHHTGLAGHDRVHHHYPNNEYQIEQQLYQEQCMSAEEGYSLTKLETRVEQQLRGNTSREIDSLTSVQSFQIFGGGTGEPSEESFHQHNTISSNFQKGYNGSDSSNSNFMNSYEDNARCYEPNTGVIIYEEPPSSLPENVIRTTSLCIERLDGIEFDRLSSDSCEQYISASALIEKEMDDEIHSQTNDETIQINEISSSVVEAPPSPPDPPEPRAKLIHKAINGQTPAISHGNTVDSTHFTKTPVPKLLLYPNVPNENHRTSRRLSIHQYPRTFEKRMLRSMTVDYSLRTLRSRNTLSKDLKSKSTPITNIRKSTIVQNKCMKTIQASSNAENSSSAISKKCLTLRSRQITTTSGIYSDSNVISIPSASSSEKHQRKSKLRSFCDKSDLTNESLTTKNRKDCKSPSALHRKSIGMSVTLSSSPHHLQQVSISFTKRSSLRNNGWGSGKTAIQTRNRVQKRMSR